MGNLGPCKTGFTGPAVELRACNLALGRTAWSSIISVDCQNPLAETTSQKPEAHLSFCINPINLVLKNTRRRAPWHDDDEVIDVCLCRGRGCRRQQKRDPRRVFARGLATKSEHLRPLHRRARHGREFAADRLLRGGARGDAPARAAPRALRRRR